MKAPIRYYGGKGNGMAQKIISYFPKDESIKNYIEPFGGSGAVLFNLPKPYPIEIYNDLEENVYSLFKVLTDKELFFEFKQKCDLTFFSEQLNREYKEKLKLKDISLLDRAFMYFYVNRSSYSGVGTFTSSTSIRRNMCKQVSDYLSTVDNLYNVHDRISKVVIHNRDALNLIEKFDKKNTVMYLDPPYHHDTRTGARYKVDMDDEQHKKMIQLLIDIKEAYVILSGYDNEGYGVLEKNGWNKYSFDVKTQTGKRIPKTKKEFLWTNY